jgi:hypothetical protein
METEPGTVVYADYENGLEESQFLREQLVKFLGLPKAPDNFLVWTPSSGNSVDIDGVCNEVKPCLFILDSLRAHDPSFEKSDHAGQGMKDLRSATTYNNGTAILAIHHTKKPGPDGPPPLDGDDTLLMHWFYQASGHRSLVNQSDTRIAADMSKRVGDAAMVLRWHRRLRSELGPTYLQRNCDGEGEPIGYSLMVGVNLLGNVDQGDAFVKLPERFTFKQAKSTYARSDDPTKKWLNKCEAVGLVRQVRRGLYEKVNG